MNKDPAGATLGRTWRRARDQLAAAGIDNAARDARLLAERAFEMDAAALALNENQPVTEAQNAHLELLLQRRLAREPVARIEGEKQFYGLEFLLNEATLVPRPETEQLVDIARDLLEHHAAPRILDLGTGSGCIIIALLAHLPSALAIAIDIDPAASRIAAENAHRHAVGDRVQFLTGSWFAPLSPDARFDLILSNPPYIEHEEIARLDPEVRLFDPVAALDGGPDGLDPYREIATHAPTWLVEGGRVVVEHGAGQRQKLRSIFDNAGFSRFETLDDLAGLDRVIVAQR